MSWLKRFVLLYTVNLSKTATLKKTKMVLKTNYRLMQVKNIAEFHLALRPLFCLFLSGRSRQVLLLVLVEFYLL